ncbi:TPA: hypothetical protein ACQN5J_001661 [Streptococcus pyogenes]|uniref:hypothetical protein n=1 Tax=Streptococcus pyogenes TaxID=1314 RepID=UPI0010A147D8|nr:hypothetical protein [Streptococcus pyogenes]VHF09840.1 Uncharacterised protein [Streptococcus pyogenes]
MKLIKQIIFFGIIIFFTISNFIRLFIDNNFGEPVKLYFREVPLFLKVIIIVIFIGLLWWSFPFNKKK